MGIGLPDDDEAVDRIRLAALVAGDDPGRHAGGSHQDDEGGSVVFAEAALGDEQEIIDRMFAEQRRLQCVSEAGAGKQCQCLLHQPFRVRISLSPGLGQLARTRVGVAGEGEVAAQNRLVLVPIETVIEDRRQGKALALGDR